MLNEKFEVIVVGAGPGGSAGAKECADLGLKTLLIEKRKLPRDKVCSGMLVSDLAQSEIQSAFGEIPDRILAGRGFLDGFMFHVPGEDHQEIKKNIPIAWRKDLDYWLNQKAIKSGVNIWDGTTLKDVSIGSSGHIRLKVNRNGSDEDVFCEYLIGADGARSIVRQKLYPELSVTYVAAYRGFFKENIDIDNRYFHCIFPEGNHHRPFFLHQKDDIFLVEFSANQREIRTFLLTVRNLLARDYDVDLKVEPFKADGCLMACFLYKDLLGGQFAPCKEKVLLVGEAAGLVFPGTLEGIGPAVRSGIIAGKSVAKAIESGVSSSKIYLEDMAGLIDKFRSAAKKAGELKNAASKGTKCLLDNYTENMQEGFEL